MNYNFSKSLGKAIFGQPHTVVRDITYGAGVTPQYHL